MNLNGQTIANGLQICAVIVLLFSGLNHPLEPQVLPTAYAGPVIGNSIALALGLWLGGILLPKFFPQKATTSGSTN